MSTRAGAALFSWDNGTILALVLTPAFLLLIYMRWALDHVVMAPPSEAALVNCMNGTCFFRERGSSVLRKIEVGDGADLSLGTILLTVGPESVAQANYRDGSRGFIKRTGLMRLGKGVESLQIQDDEAPSAAEPAPIATPKENLLYVADIPLRLLNPKPGAAIIFREFPARFSVVFEKLGDVPKQAQFLRWRLFEATGPDTKNFLQEIIFSPAQQSGTQFFAELLVPRPARYLLFPKGRESNLKDGLVFEVRGTNDLESQVKNLLQGSDRDPAANIEIRSD